MRDASGDPVFSPFTVVVDSRENLPYSFAGLRADARQGRRPLVVPLVGRCLNAGDYSVEGYESRVAVERKSHSDIVHTIGQQRDRFERELARLAEYDYAAVMVEASWATILQGHARSRLPPKVVHRSVIAWQQRFPRVHWWTVEGRELAEVTTYRILERYWRDTVAALSPPQTPTTR